MCVGGISPSAQSAFNDGDGDDYDDDDDGGGGDVYSSGSWFSLY